MKLSVTAPRTRFVVAGFVFGMSTVSNVEANEPIVTLGTRPYYLVSEMKPSALKSKLESCASSMSQFKKSDFSIGHRGACMMYPEHTIESYTAAAQQGAGIIECDVTFTKDLELICRHAQCDLHATTDVVARPELNAKCTTPWSTGVEPKCCASDFTLEEIKSLCGKMDAAGNIDGETAEHYVYGGTADWRTDLYSNPNSCPEIPTHKESIELIKTLGGGDLKYTPELKSPSVEMPFGESEFTQEDYAQKMIDEYVDAGIPPSHVWPQSFNPDDVYYWIQNTDYGDQAVALDNKYDASAEEFEAWHATLSENGVKIVAPTMWMLVTTASDSNDDAEMSSLSEGLGIVPSAYTESAKNHGLDIITWTLERTPPGLDGWYWQSLAENELTDGDKFALLQVLAEDVGVLGVFSDWPATTTFFANCMEIGMDVGYKDDESTSSATGDEEDCTTFDELCMNDDYSTFCGLVDEFDLQDVLSGSGDDVYTVFVPVNEAFDTTATKDMLGALLEETKVEEALKFHIAVSAHSELECKEVIEMSNGKDSRTICDEPDDDDALTTVKYQIGGGNRQSGILPQIIGMGTLCGGGIYYTINEVMLPQNVMPREEESIVNLGRSLP